MKLTKFELIGNNLEQKLVNASKVKQLLSNINSEFHTNFIKEILFNETIVKHKGEFYLYGYSCKGSLSKYDFLNDANFIQAVKLTTRKVFRNIK